MPNYTFLNKETGEYTVENMKMAELDDFKKNNPHLEQQLTPIPLADPVRIGITKGDSQFQNVLKQIKKQNPGSTISTGNISEV